MSGYQTGRKAPASKVPDKPIRAISNYCTRRVEVLFADGDSLTFQFPDSFTARDWCWMRAVMNSLAPSEHTDNAVTTWGSVL